MSLVQELKKKSSSHIKLSWIIGSIVGLALIYGAYSYFSSSEEAIVTVPTEYTVKKNDITLWLVTDGKIQGNNTLSLGFEANGKITSIKKNIGDTVKVWEIVGTVDSAAASIDLRKAQNSLAQAMANYSIKVKPLSELEKEQIEWGLAINRITYENKILGFEQDIANAEKTIVDLQKKLENYQGDLAWLIGSSSTVSITSSTFTSEIKNIYRDIYQYVITMDIFLGISDNNKDRNDAFESLIAANNPGLRKDAEKLWIQSSKIREPDVISLSQNIIDKTLADIAIVQKLSDTIVSIIDATPTDETKFSAQKAAFERGSFVTVRASLAGYYQSIAGLTVTDTAVVKTDTDKKRSIDQQIAQAKTDIIYQEKQIALKKKEIEQSKISNEQELTNNKIDYSLKLDPLSNDEKILAQLQLDSARIAVQEKEIAVWKTALRSPVDGVILTLVGHVGETAPSTFVTIATQGYTYVESSISEDEIEMIKVWQKAIITPESLPDAAFEGEVYYVSTVGDTDNNGIVTYKVFIKYTSPDTRLRTAMNVSISFINKQVRDVMVAPIKAVFAYENTPHVRLKDGTLKQVITGLSDGKQTEIISGVSVGDILMIQ